MYLTSAQVKALWFIVFVLGATVLLRYAKVWFFSEPSYDFTAFEKTYIQKRDSLQAVHEKLLSHRNDSKKNSPPQSWRPSGNTGQQNPVNINTAGAQQLQTLPRIGPVMAQRILKYRQQNGPFRSKQELKKVKGIGPKTLENLKALITVD